MGITRIVAFLAVFAMFAACGDVNDVSGYRLSSSSSKNCTGDFCSSSSGNSSSSSSINNFAVWQEWLELKQASKHSYVHGATNITLDAFVISKKLITQGQYKEVMKENPSRGAKNDTLPVESVNWFKALEFCKKLSALMGLDSAAVKLPTEAEWEYTAISSDIQINEDYWEWTNDCWDDYFPYTVNNPSGPPNCSSADYRVRKGFLTSNGIEDRYRTDPYSIDIGVRDISFRVVIKNKFLN